MSRRDYSQKTFLDYLSLGSGRRRKRLERLDQLSAQFDWSRLDRLFDEISCAKRGGSGYPPLCLFKALLLAQWYNLSDPALEDALADRLSFRRFCGFPLDEDTPDETTFVRFRAKLRALKLYEKLFAEVNQQIEQKGFLVKSGTLIDASIIKARAKPPREKEGVVSMVDPDAGFTKKRKESYFGYKIHIGVDAGSDLIRKVETSSASLHDSLAFGALVCGDEQKVYADKAYGSAENRKLLEDNGIEDRLMYKAVRNKPLKSWQTWFNKAVSSIRAAVERVFAIGQNSYGLEQTRYFGEDRVEANCLMFSTAYNMRRVLSLA